MNKYEFYDEHFVSLATNPEYSWQFVNCYEAWVPQGWDELTKTLCDEINKIVPKNHRKKFTWKQFKQKFGGLRAYCEFGKLNKFGEPVRHTEEEGKIARLIYDVVEEAEKKSQTICEICGKSSKTTTIKRYVTTRCEEHSKET